MLASLGVWQFFWRLPGGSKLPDGQRILFQNSRERDFIAISSWWLSWGSPEVPKLPNDEEIFLQKWLEKYSLTVACLTALPSIAVETKVAKWLGMFCSTFHEEGCGKISLSCWLSGSSPEGFQWAQSCHMTKSIVHFQQSLHNNKYSRLLSNEIDCRSTPMSLWVGDNLDQ